MNKASVQLCRLSQSPASATCISVAPLDYHLLTSRLRGSITTAAYTSVNPLHVTTKNLRVKRIRQNSNTLKFLTLNPKNQLARNQDQKIKLNFTRAW